MAATARRRGGGGSPRRRKWLLALPPVLGAGALLAWLLLPRSLPASPYTFELRPGHTLKAVARDLADQGLLSAPWLFSTLGRLDPRSSHLRAGNYVLDQAASPLDLYGLLFRGRAGQFEVTLVEGQTLRQIRALLAREPALSHEVDGLSDEALLGRIASPLHPPSGFPLVEGLFLPDTYFFTRGSSDLSILKRAAQALDRSVQAQWPLRDAELPIETPYQALILASIVERETARAEERPRIAGVFVNRLRQHMRLQTDPSVIYGLGLRYDGHLHHHDLLMDTPWNTYTREGLPPTPIGLAGTAALQAALHPATTSALYFVARGDGSHVFSDTLAAHNAAVEAWKRHLEEVRQ